MKVKLGDICDIKSGGTPLRSNNKYWDNGNIPWVKISDINNKYLYQTSEHITELGLKNSSAKLFNKGTILYTIFATLGDVCILDIDATTNQAIAGITLLNNKIDKNYLYYYLVSKKNYVNTIGRGVAQNNINLNILRNFSIDILPLEEQKKIANTLDKVTNLIELRKKQLEKLDIFSKSLFVEMFGDPVENPMNWKKEKLINLGTLKNGVNFNLTNKGFKIYCLGVSDFKDLNIINNIESLSTITLQKKPPEDYLLKNGDIVFVRSNGNKLLVGRSVLICNNNILTTFSGFCIRFRLTSNRIINIYYLLTLLKSDFMRNKMRGRGVNIQNLNQKILSDLDIFIPPIELQNKFAKRVKHIDKIKSDIQNSLNKLETLKKSLMQEYFG